MKLHFLCVAALFLGNASPRLSQTAKETKPKSSSAAPSTFTADYPKDEAGMLIENSGWTSVPNEAPSKTKVKHGLAHALTTGAVPAAVVATYDGAHAQIQVPPGRPILCICHVLSIPGAPALVKLHSKKGSRELDGGRLPIMGAKITEAAENDLITVEVSQPENTVWLVRPREALPPGEYALMLGTQNMSIFPFTVVNNDSAVSPPDKH